MGTDQKPKARFSTDAKALEERYCLIHSRRRYFKCLSSFGFLVKFRFSHLLNSMLNMGIGPPEHNRWDCRSLPGNPLVEPAATLNVEGCPRGEGPLLLSAGTSRTNGTQSSALPPKLRSAGRVSSGSPT
jgi:hypothetical protein